MDAEKKDRIETVDCVDQAININDNEANSFDDEKTTSGYDMNTESTDPIGSHTSLPVAPKRKHKSDSSVIKTVRFALDSDYSRDETVEPINGQNFETTSAENDQKNNAANSHLPKVLSDQSQEFIDALSKKLLKDKRKFDGVTETVQTSVPSQADNLYDCMPKVIVHRITFDTPVKNHSFYEKKNELNLNNVSLLKSKIGMVQNSNQKNEEIDQKDKAIVHKIQIENTVEESKKIKMQADTNGKDVKDLSIQESEPPKNVESKSESKIGVYTIKIEIPSESSPKEEIKSSSETEKLENKTIVHKINVETKGEYKNKIDACEGVKNEPNNSKTIDKEAKIVVHTISMEANNGNDKNVKDFNTKEESNMCAGQEKVIVHPIVSESKTSQAVEIVKTEKPKSSVSKNTETSKLPVKSNMEQKKEIIHNVKVDDEPKREVKMVKPERLKRSISKSRSLNSSTQNLSIKAETNLVKENIVQKSNAELTKVEPILKKNAKKSDDKNVDPLLKLENDHKDKIDSVVNKIVSSQARVEAALQKAEGELMITKRLRSTADQLQQEYSSLKKILESERSAFREYKALQEAESRKERAEAKRREAALEGQLRSALKGSPPVCRGPSKLGPADCEVAKLSQSLHAAKSEMKGLQEKLQMVTEADKRKAGELRAQHDANVAHVQQMERDVRAQTAKLLEELKSKERHLEQVRKAAMGALGARGGQGGSRGAPNKMAVADQLHMMESQISRLESELQRRDDIIQTLRTSKLRRDRQLMAQRQSKENLYKDTMSDVDSAVSSAPNSLSPQPSPDLWFRSHDGLQGEVDEAVLEMAKKQIQELEKALSISAAGQRSAQQRAAQLEEQLQDLREQADLLEFRCLELEDTSEKRNAIEELTDSDSGCTSPEHRLKNSVSPQLRRSDSGYKSPTLCPNSPNLGNHRVLTTPPSEILEINPASSLYKSQIDALHLRDIDSVFDGGDRNGDVRDRLERMLLKSHSEEDRSCLEQVLQLMWNLQALSINISDNYSKVKNKRVSNGEIVKNDVDNTNRSSKIIATISPYSQTSLKAVDLQKSSDFDEPDFVNILIKEESKKLLSGLQESGIFEEADWETKGTQTDWCDCICNEPESDLATEVQRLNQIREQLEKSGAIRNKSFKNRQRSNDSVVVNDKVDAKRREKTFYENRIAILEDKISIYESSDDIKEKKLVQRLQVEVDLQAKIDILESDLDIIKQRYEILEEERCEFEEAENDTRLHCQELEAEFELLSAKLRDMDEQRGCSKNEAACYRALVQEYEDKSAHLQAHVADLLRRLEDMEDAASAIIFWQIYKIIEPHPEFDFKAAFHAKFPDQVLPDDNESQTGEDENNSMTSFMVCQEEYNPLECIEKQLESLLKEKIEIQKNYKRQVDLSKKDMAALEKTIMENAELLKKQEEKSRWKIEMLERELKQLQDVVSSSDSNSDDDKTDDELKKKIQSLTGIINEQRQRIDELKKREVAFLATLTQGDEMWAEMESTYKQKVKEFEENEAAFKEEIDKAKAEIHKWKGKFELSEQKVHELEYKEAELEKIIEKLERDSKDAVSQNSVLNNENQNLRSELLSSKSSMQELESYLKNELSMQKKTSEKIQEELSLQSKHSLETIKEHKQKVSSLKTELSKSLKDWSELEVTNNELKKEVHTLDTQLQEITNKMIRQSSEYEEKIQLLHEELSNKCKEAEQMQREIEQSQSLPSAHEELKEVDEATSKHYGETSDPDNINQHIGRTALSPVQIKPSSDMCTCTHIEKSTQTDEITRASVDESSSGSYFSCDCCTQTNATEQIQEIQSSEPTNRQSTSEMNASNTTQDVFSQTSQEVLTDKDKVKEKPALPERKPKLPARSNSKLKIDEQKKRLSRAGVSGTRSQEESIKKLSKDLANNLMNSLDSQTCLAEKSKMVEGSDGKTPSVEDSVSGIGSDKAEIENNFCKIIRESFDSYLEGVKSSAHRQEPVTPEGRVHRNIQLKSVADKIQVSQSDVQYDTIKALKKAFEPEEDYSGVYTVRSIGHSFSDRPIPAPRGNSHKAHNGVKKAESFSETTKLHSLPFIQEKFSNQDLSYTPATLNTTTDALKCSLKSTEGEPLKLFVPYHNQNAPKSLGSLVYERVAKITNEMNINNSTVPQLISLKRSVSMTADNKSITGKNVYIYNDL